MNTMFQSIARSWSPWANSRMISANAAIFGPTDR